MYKALCVACGGKKDVTAGFVTDCLGLLEKQTGRFITLPDGLVAKRSYGELIIGKEQVQEEEFCEVIRSFPYQTEYAGGTEHWTLTLELRELTEEKNLKKMSLIPKSTYTKWFDYDKINEVVSWKTPEPEDVLALYADGRGKRVSEVLKMAKVPLEERKRIRILAAGNRVLWIPGIRGSEAYHVTKETKHVLIATIDGGNKDGRQD